METVGSIAEGANFRHLCYSVCGSPLFPSTHFFFLHSPKLPGPLQASHGNHSTLLACYILFFSLFSLLSFETRVFAFFRLGILLSFWKLPWSPTVRAPCLKTSCFCFLWNFSERTGKLGCRCLFRIYYSIILLCYVYFEINYAYSLTCRHHCVIYQCGKFLTWIFIF